jgi:hypothetical protein
MGLGGLTGKFAQKQGLQLAQPAQLAQRVSQLYGASNDKELRRFPLQLAHVCLPHREGVNPRRDVSLRAVLAAGTRT